jgi:hypothetical protein
MKEQGKLRLVSSLEIIRGLTGKNLDDQIKKEFEAGLKRFEQQPSLITVHQKLA